MTCKFVRIQGRENAYRTKYPRGIFAMCWKLIGEGGMSEEDEKLFRDIDDWFKVNLPEPVPCVNGETVITFFKTETTEEMLGKIAPAVALMDKYNQPYDIIYTNFVGTIVYEDEWQVAVRVEDGKMV